MKYTTIMGALAGIPLSMAVQPPKVNGMKVTWKETFEGCGGCSPSDKVWDTALHIDTNGEMQDYTESNKNIQLSGGDTLQLVPRKDKKGAWTSGRIETKDSWTPQPNKKMTYQAGLRLGDSTDTQGIWSAFWMLGDAVRHGTEWPLCGELDIFEQVNGDGLGHGTVHCGPNDQGGPCNEGSGLGSSVPMLGSNTFHDWSLTVDRTPGSWQAETITWAMDGLPFQVITGAQIGDEGIWSTLAHSPFYIILNVAVGGNWPVSSFSPLIN